MKIISKKSQGFTLVELLITLVVVGLLLSLAYPKFAKSNASSKGQSLGADVVTLASDITAGYQGQYASVSDAAIVSGSLLKNVGSITNNAGTLTTNMGGTISCAPSRLVANNDSFTCTITSVKDGACPTLATALGRSSVKLLIAGATVKAPGVAMDAAKVTCADDDTEFVATFS
ncbi:type 4 pilus major pilin [Undibacterium sp.]|uniref:type 4 pilus major pilin n=1 Tax=Undibacterium sp. TaxID=1914977 RepID=UPI0037527DB7